MNGAGASVAAWASTQDGSSRGVFAQRFGSGGTAVGAEFQVNSYTLNFQGYASVAMRSDGSFLVGWESNQDGDLEGIFARSFAADGAPKGVEFRVNSYTRARRPRRGSRRATTGS